MTISVKTVLRLS